MNKEEKQWEVIRGIQKNPKGWYFVLGFFCIFTLIPVLIITAIINEESKFSRWLVLLLIVPLFLLIFGIWGIAYTIKHRVYNNRLYEHLKNWTILEEKAIITKFKYFREHDTEHSFGKEWYIIVANIWEHIFKSEKINVLIFWAEGKDIDKKFYEEKDIPYSPNDPKFNKNYKKRQDDRIKEIDAQLAWLSEELEHVSRFKKKKIQKEINKLVIEKIWTSPKALPYKGKSYYIGDEITVLIDPDNPKNYTM
jgi:hypothetical protein